MLDGLVPCAFGIVAAEEVEDETDASAVPCGCDKDCGNVDDSVAVSVNEGEDVDTPVPGAGEPTAGLEASAEPSCEDPEEG